jgi:hypothetical protein
LENCRCVAEEERVSQLLLELVGGQQSAGSFFLNCTKNTELTGAVFARTFSSLAKHLAGSGQRHMRSGQWKTYRTRFLVKARKLSSNLTFVDSLGRQHSGRKGDYLVESSEGVISIAPRRIFEDIYVAMGLEDADHGEHSSRSLARNSAGDGPVGRKLPQPCGGRSVSGARVGMM